METIFTPETLIAFFTLTLLEIVLGIDNIIFITIIADRLPQNQQAKARNLGLLLAMVSRIILLFGLSWVMRLTTPLFTVLTNEISGRDLILIFGGFFLLAKSTLEIHRTVESHDSPVDTVKKTFAGVIFQIIIIDMIFSLDSVITAVGLTEQIGIMIAAVVIAVCVMMLAAKSISDFVGQHPTLKMLALSFLILVGMALIGEGLAMHIPKGYIYFAMAFSVLVEMLNIKVRKKIQAARTQ